MCVCNNMQADRTIRVLIVDDSFTVQKTLGRILSEDPEIEVIGCASDPYEAAELMRTQAPDVITLDVEMPRMDGLTFLRKLMRQHPIPVVMCSSITPENSDKAMEALELGAVEVFTKPKLGTAQHLEEISIQFCDAIKAAAKVRFGSKPPSKPKSSSPKAAPKRALKVSPKLTADAVIPPREPNRCRAVAGQGRMIAIGASTGGTEALKSVLTQLPLDCPPIFIVQHMPAQFTGSFASRLDELCSIRVKEAVNQVIVTPGMAVIAPGDKHMLIRYTAGNYRVELRDGPLVSRHRPSVDVLFRSAAQFAPGVAIGAILTGMGDDGAHGMLEMHDMGSQTVAQNEKSCVVFGMPKEAITLGGVDHISDLTRIPSLLMQLSE
ncbi:protein-glutamate methylesterase/protein-glutamine glutaminase [Magnetococcus sp. PR-3]|uniref:protein-glutamate methylesterase/protein-glutamine glutaminase n=1 Tax=Magnetococcus sp. PR-3 TaxID=3120355 RepID=UPI002FCDFFEE